MQGVTVSAKYYASFEHFYACEISRDGRDDSIAITLLRSGSNMGYAGGNNVGLAWAIAEGCEYALIMNNDVKVESDFLGGLIEVDLETRASVVGALVKDFTGGSTCEGFSSCGVFLLRRAG